MKFKLMILIASVAFYLLTIFVYAWECMDKIPVQSFNTVRFKVLYKYFHVESNLSLS